MVWFKCQTIAGAPAGGTDGLHSEQHECEEKVFSPFSVPHCTSLSLDSAICKRNFREKKSPFWEGSTSSVHFSAGHQVLEAPKYCTWEKNSSNGNVIVLYSHKKIWYNVCDSKCLIWHFQIYSFILPLPLYTWISCFVLNCKLNRLREIDIFQDEKLTFIYKTKTVLYKTMLIMSVWILFLLVREDLHLQETRTWKASHLDPNQMWFWRMFFVTVIHLSFIYLFIYCTRNGSWTELPFKVSTCKVIVDWIIYVSINIFSWSIFNYFVS